MGKKLGSSLLGAAISTAFAVATGGVSTAFFTLAAGTAGRYFATNLVLGFIAQSLAPKPSTPAQLSGQLVASRNPLGARKVIYGRTRTSGTIVFMESTGDENKYFHQIVTLAGHEISAVDLVAFNDEIVGTNLLDATQVGATGTYESFANITAHFGSVDQVADANLVSETSMTTNHRLRGIAYVYTRMMYDQDTYPSGIPNVSALVKGKPVYDPRTATTGYSNNSALCLLDYIMDDTYGLGADLTEIDAASFITAANICDESVTITGGSEKRYTTNGIIDTSRTPASILQELAAAMAGTVYYSNGKWHCKAGAYITPTITLTEDDFIGQIDVTTRVSNQSNFNAVRGVFVSPQDNYQPVDFPPIKSGTFEAEDGNERKYADMTLPFTTSSATAQRLAKIALYRNREQITVSVACKLTAFRFDIGDTLMLTLDRMGWSNKVFEVVSWQYSGSEVPSVTLVLKETSTTVYNWSTADEGALSRNDTNLPNPFTVGTPRNLSVTQIRDILNDGAYQSQVLVEWDAPLDGFVTYYEVQWKRGTADNDYGLIGDAAVTTNDYGLVTGSVDATLDYGLVSETLTGAENYWNSALTTDQQLVINNALEAEYVIRVRSVNSFGVRSAWVTDGITPLADTTPPAAPSNMLARGGFRLIEVTWSNPSDADYDVTNLYRNTTNNAEGAAFVGSTKGTTYTDTGLGMNETFYYWTKASDRSGNDSEFSSGVSATTAFVDSDDFSAEVMNLFAEAGAYGIEPVATLPAAGDFDGQIKYDTTNNKLWRWDAASGTWSDDIFSIESGSVDLASFAAGIEPVGIVDSLPNPVGYTGAQVVFLTTDNKLYRYDSSVPEWSTAVSAVDIDGQIASTNFPQDLRPVEVLSSLPTTGNFDGRQVYLTTDKKLYRYNGTAFTAAVATTDLSGTIADTQIAALAASKITGQMTDSQIAALDAAKLLNQLQDDQIAAINAAKLTGQITETQISDDAITTPKLAAGAVTASEIAADTITAANIASGAITASELAANSVTTSNILAGAVTADSIASSSITTAKIAANAVTANEISAGSVTTAKIAAGAITSDTIASNAVTAGKVDANAITAGTIAAGAITSDKLATNSVTAAKIVSGSISADKIASNAITSSKIAADAITAGKIAAGAVSTSELAADAITSSRIAAGAITTDTIAAGAVQTDKIAANSITGGLIAASGVITNSAQIENSVITNAKIQNGAITTAKIGNLAVDTIKIAGQAVTVPGYIAAPAYDIGMFYTIYDSSGNNPYSVFILTSLVQSYVSDIKVSVNGIVYSFERPAGGTLYTKAIVLTLTANTTYTIRLWSSDTRNRNGSSIYALATKR